MITGRQPEDGVNSFLHKELGRKVEKLKHMKSEVMQPNVKNRSELSARE